jgi:hypothetical protein
MALRRYAVLLSKEMREAGLPAKTLISIIDDDDDVREALAGLMKSQGFTVEAFPWISWHVRMFAIPPA